MAQDLSGHLMGSPAARTAFEVMLADLEPQPDMMPSEWAQRAIRLVDGDRPGRYSFGRGYGFQAEVLDTFFGPFKPGETLRVGCAFKGAQSGVTLLCIIGLLYWACVRRVSVAHMMPRQHDADDQSKRMATLIDASPELTGLIPPGLLRVRRTRRGQNLRVVYSNSLNELKSWSAGVVVVDEADDCESRAFDSISALLQRMGAYRRRLQLLIGTPSIPDYGIHSYWMRSTQRRRWQPCLVCGDEQVLEWEGNIRWDKGAGDDEAQAATAMLVCRFCGAPWDLQLREMSDAEGRWQADQPGAAVEGFGMNRLMVPTSNPREMVRGYLRGLRSPIAMREHMNQTRGMAFLPTTGKLDDRTVHAAFDHDLTWGEVPAGTVRVTMGVDTQGEPPSVFFVWEVVAYDEGGFATIIHFGVGTEADVLAVAGQEGAAGLIAVDWGLVDISDGEHKAAVEDLCAACPALDPARFDYRRRAGFKRGKVERIKRGIKGYALDDQDALDVHLSRFYEAGERGRRVRIAVPPRNADRTALVDHYTHIARLREETAQGPTYRYKKLREEGVDYPYAGALADYAHDNGGRRKVAPGGAAFGPMGASATKGDAAYLRSLEDGPPKAKKWAVGVVKRKNRGF